MKILSENQDSFLSIEVADTEFLHWQSLNLSVNVMDEGFAGAYDGVWLGLDDFQKFVSDLRDCEQTRKGKASLSSFSPGEFELVIENCDGWGHFLLRYTLGRTTYISQVSLAKVVSGGFELDAGCFAELVSDFADLMAAILSKRVAT